VGVFAGPEIVEDGLVLALDAGNTKGYDKYENLLPYSIVSETGWSTLYSTLTPNATTAPDGTNTAARIQVHSPGSSNGYVAKTNIQVSAGTTYTFSFWLKSVSGSGTWGINIYDHATGVGHNRTTVNITEEWQRVSYSYTPTGTLVNVYVSDDRENLSTISDGYVWGAQLEAGSSVTDYYATTGTAKTRGSVISSGIGTLTGTLTNGVGYNSSNGGSFTFDGVNDYMTSTFTFTAGQAVTISGWLYSTESTTTYRNFVDTSTKPMIWWDTAGKIEFDTGSGYRTPSVYRNQWVYVTLVKPSGDTVASYYVNGVFASNGGVSYSVTASTPTWFNRNGGQTWLGNCSNVSIYNRVLTASEVKQNFNATRGRFGI